MLLCYARFGCALLCFAVLWCVLIRLRNHRQHQKVFLGVHKFSLDLHVCFPMFSQHSYQLQTLPSETKQTTVDQMFCKIKEIRRVKNTDSSLGLLGFLQLPLGERMRTRHPRLGTDMGCHSQGHQGPASQPWRLRGSHGLGWSTPHGTTTWMAF